jgi:WD40 repeat protein
MFFMFRIGLWLMVAAPLCADVEFVRTSLVPSRLRLVREHQLPMAIHGYTQSSMSGDSMCCAARTGTSVIIFSTMTGEKMIELETGGDIHDGAFSYDGTQYCTAHNDGTIKTWDIRTGKETAKFHTGSGFSCAVCFTRDGRTIVADNGERTGLILYNIPDKKEQRRVGGSGSSYTYVSNDGRYAVASVGVVRIIDLKEDRVVKEILPRSVIKAALSPDSRACVAGDSVGRLVKWSLATGEELASLKMEAGRANWLDYSPDGRWIAVSDAAGSVMIVDAQKFSVSHTVDLKSDPATEGAFLVGFTKKGDALVVISSSGKIRIFSSR